MEQGEAHVQSLKKFSAIALVLMIGAAFHTLCWSNLLSREGRVERQTKAMSCPCSTDQRFSKELMPVVKDQKNWWAAGTEALALTQ